LLSRAHRVLNCEHDIIGNFNELPDEGQVDATRGE
jgi:hypothetical protein